MTRIKKLLVIMACCFLCTMVSCGSSGDSSVASSENSGWKYYDEMSSVPTADSCLDDVIFETSFPDDEGNMVYGYIMGTDSAEADQKYSQYLDILENTCGFEFVKKPNMALARKNGESLFGVGLGSTDKGVYFLDVLFFTGDNDTSTDTYTETPASDYLDTQQDTQQETPSQSATMGEQQALKKAWQYLDYTAFSHDGLVDQLEYEGFSHSEAVYAADNCGANWNEQAAKKAQQYLDYSSFSRQELISQLEYEKFTSSQAEYGASAVGY